MDIVTSSIAQGLLWSVMAIGVYLTFRILDIADMTAEGSFPLGAAITAHAIVTGVGPIAATLIDRKSTRLNSSHTVISWALPVAPQLVQFQAF